LYPKPFVSKTICPSTAGQRVDTGVTVVVEDTDVLVLTDVEDTDVVEIEEELEITTRFFTAEIKLLPALPDETVPKLVLR